MFKTLIVLLISLLFVSQSFALSSTRPAETFGEISRSCNSMVECHNRIVAETGNLETTGEQLIMNVYVEAESLGGK